MKSRPVRSAARLLLLAASARAQPSPTGERRNWFEDPFFRISGGLPGCPVPLGPRRSAAS